MMKFSELKELFENYEHAQLSPVYQDIHFGCDCGCGGDYYEANPTQWEDEISNAETAILAMKSFCKNYNIEYDGLE